MEKRLTTLSANVLRFCRALREQGFLIGPAEEVDALEALASFPFGEEYLFRNALGAVLVKNKFQYDHFDRLYMDFWEELKRAVDSKNKEVPEKKNKKKSKANPKQPTVQALKDWLYGKETTEQTELSSYSSGEVLAKKDFGNMNEEELRLVMTMLQKMARKLAHQKSRLKKNSKRKKSIDLKRTFRANMRRGGELQKFMFSEKKDKKLRLVLLCDVSKSMDLYSRFFMYLIYAFQNAYDKIDTFVFSTVLHQVTEVLDAHEFNRAFEIIADRVPQWSGGTQIGNCLQRFVTEHQWHLLDKKTVVLILSDGWDTGEPEILRSAMRQIYKSSKKVIWLNPLAGNPNYSPDVTGMQTALPYVDVFAPAHNLESLKTAMHAIRTRRKLVLQKEK